MADMDEIQDIADEYKLLVIEDACQAHGAEYFSRKDNAWKKAGSVGIAAAFSFYPGKNLGACGEAGAVTTSDSQIAQRVRMIRDTAKLKSTITTLRDITAGWTRFRQAFYRLNSSI